MDSNNIRVVDKSMDSLHIYASIIRFYSRQTMAIDSGDIDAYGHTFSTKATIINSITNRRLFGRAAILDSGYMNLKKRMNAGTSIRHYMFCTRIVDNVSQSLFVSSQVLIVSTSGSAVASILAAVSCDDIISKVDDNDSEFEIGYRAIADF